jgi:hypothetical protein
MPQNSKGFNCQIASGAKSARFGKTTVCATGSIETLEEYGSTPLTEPVGRAVFLQRSLHTVLRVSTRYSHGYEDCRSPQ